MSVRNDEEQYLHKTIAAYPVFSEPFTYSDVIEAIIGDDSPLSLEMIEKETIKHIDNSKISVINDTMSFLTCIVEKPRMFIKSIEEKVPIDQAKRINYHAIAKLSRDSNDWYSRTVISVKPKQIHAEVTEDTFDIYENRFIVTLFDLIYRVVNTEYNNCVAKLKNAGSALALDLVSRLYTGYNPNWGFSDVCNGNRVRLDFEYRRSLNEMKDSLEILLRRISILRSSELYRALRNKKRLTGSVQKTNILMFDYNYNRAYKLWLYLHENHFDDSVMIEEETIPQEALSKDYHLYCFLCLCACLSKIGVNCTKSPQFLFDSNGLSADGIAQFSYNGNVLELELRESNYVFRYHIDHKYEQHEVVKKKIHHIASEDELETVDEFWFCPRYDNLEEMSQSDLMEYTTELFDNLASDDPEEEFTGRYAMISINLDSWGEKNLEESLCRRIFNSGDNLSSEESEDDLKRWSNFKTGIVLASAYPFRGSSGLSMISKVFYNHLLKPKLHTKEMECCPICGNSLSNRGHDYICNQCNIRISHTYCKSCDPKKQKPFFWIKFKDDSILENEEEMKNCETTPLYKMDLISRFMPICTLTSFDIGSNRTGVGTTIYKFKTICPRCGVKLGEGDED